MHTLGATAAALTLSVGLVFSGIALAAGGHKHGAKHGGQYVEVEGHQGVELVASADSITFYITENDKPADLKGASFKAIVQTGTGIKIYPLKVEGGSLKVKLTTALPTGTKIVISGKDGHGHTLQARFVTK